MATIRKRTWQTRSGPKTAWVADYFDRDGRRHIKTFSRKGDATDWLPQTQQAVKVGRHVADSRASTVAAAAAAWIRSGEVDLERSTIAQRREHVDGHIVPLLGADTKLSKVDVKAFRVDLLTRSSRAMAKKVMTSFKAILKEEKLSHLAADVRPIESGRRHERKLEVGVDIPAPDEIRAMLEAADAKARALVRLGAFAGLRASEFRGLTWACTKLDEAAVTITQRADKWGTIGPPKSEAAIRKITLSAETVTALRAWKLAQPAGRTLVFGTSADRADMLNNIQRRLLNPLQVAAGVVTRDGKPKYAAHALRHYAISSWLKTCNGDFKAVQTRAGHAALALTWDTYGHLLDNRDADQIAAAEKLLLG